METASENKVAGVIRDVIMIGDRPIVMRELSGVYFEGTQYYDFRNILFINNNGMANLIELLKSLLENGTEVRFVNVNEKIKTQIKSMGLDHILNCDT
jgi:hypothetical protein